MLKYLRIAVSVLSLTACVLLITLWARSFRSVDAVSLTTDSHIVHIDSMFRRLKISYHHPLPRSSNFAPGLQRGWLTHSGSNEGWVAAVPDYSAFGFGWKTYGNGIGVFVPYWFTVLVTAAFATLPWIKWRFSLR